MKRNGLIKLLILVAALNIAGCGGAANSAGGDSKTASASTGVNAASPTPTTEGVASAVATPAAAPTPAVSAAGDSAARQSASPTSETRNANSAPQAKMPKPQIGSGGNDLFLFTQARAAVNNDADLKAANVVVDVKEGVVTLSGTVASAALKSKAEELARGVGPKDVKNQLKVSAGR
jgi:hyperosmotically inducible protein